MRIRAATVSLLLGLFVLSCRAQYDDNDAYGYGGTGYGYDDGYGEELYGYGYGYGYGDGYGDEDTNAEVGYDNEDTPGGYYNQYGYYGDEDQAYYEYYGYYADDQYGYQDYYTEEDQVFEECFLSSDGKPVLANGTAPCDIKISGVDKQASKVKSGIDGIYKLTSCYNGKAMYRRAAVSNGEDRVLWYSSTFGDWDISRGAEPSEAEILMYGGEMEHASVPLFVTSWHLGADVKDSTDALDDEYKPITVQVKCADGKIYKPTNPSSVSQVGPALTDDEMEMKYRVIYNRYGHGDNSPTVSFTFVFLLVMTGLTIILAIPYFLLKKKGTKATASATFAQILQDTRKKQIGHVS